VFNHCAQKAPNELEPFMNSSNGQSVRAEMAKKGTEVIIRAKGLTAGYEWAQSFKDPDLLTFEQV
jgi:hypothetical protein